MAPVQDVSAGGMCILLPANMKISLRDTIKFSVIKSNSLKKIIAGEGKIVRVENEAQQLSIGVQFTEVQQ